MPRKTEIPAPAEYVIDDATAFRRAIRAAAEDAGLSGYALAKLAAADGVCTQYTVECLMADPRSVRSGHGKRTPSFGVAIALARLAGCEVIIRRAR